MDTLSGARRALLFITVLRSFALCEARSSMACYGHNPQCDYYSMECPTSQIIKLYNLYAGYKNDSVCGTNSTNRCDYSHRCCTYIAGDVIETFKLENIYNTYTNCSGRQFCTNVQAPWQLMINLLPTVVTSTYVYLEYGCEPASSKIPICGDSEGSVSGKFSYAEIMFDGSVENFDPIKTTKECQCTIQNTGFQQNSVITLIDVRLQSYYKAINDTVAACSSALLLVSNVFAMQCAQTTKDYASNFLYNRMETLNLADFASSEISLSNLHTNGINDSPAMVWISFQAEPGRTFTVTCNEVIPGPFATVTPTAGLTKNFTSTPSPPTTSVSTLTTIYTASTTPSTTTSIYSTSPLHSSTDHNALTTASAHTVQSLFTSSTTASKIQAMTTSMSTRNSIATKAGQSNVSADSTKKEKTTSQSIGVYIGIAVGASLFSSFVTAGLFLCILRYRKTKCRIEGTAEYSIPSVYDNLYDYDRVRLETDQTERNTPNNRPQTVTSNEGERIAFDGKSASAANAFCTPNTQNEEQTESPQTSMYEQLNLQTNGVAEN